MFITFEGIDGCGKSTQIKRLKLFLEEHGHEVVTLREPGGTDFSEKLRSLLLESDYNLSPTTELLLFEAARNHLVEQVIKPALDAGKVVLSDRFYDSTTAYQGYGRGLQVDMVKEINNIAVNGTKPDITFYLKLDLHEAEKRSHKKEKDRIEKSGSVFFLKVKEGFDLLAENEKERIVVIDSSQDVDNTHAEILEHVRKYIKI